MTDRILRLYTDKEKFESTIAFYENIQGIDCEMRFNIAERDIQGAKIGGVLILSGEKESLDPVRDIQAIFYVDSLGEFEPWLKENGAEIVHGPHSNAFGKNMMVRNPDGLLVEYFEAKTDK
ncbi:VOC family protein [Paenibacillus sabinae]|uniref:VOC family protein n=1 Tax=Paenibacillus sabinae TaxID=365617 RepID=UPI00118715C4|nr:glyoxalase [Paenibacillus sabinae]